MNYIPLLIATLAVTLLSFIGYKLLRLFVFQYNQTKRSYRMVFLRVAIPKKDSKEDRDRESEALSASKDFKEVLGVMTQFYEALYAVYSGSRKAKWHGQQAISLEYAVLDGQIFFYIVVPPELTDFVEKQLTAYYPDCFIEQVPDYSIFQEGGSVSGTYLDLSMDYAYPFRSYPYLNIDPLNNIANAFSKIQEDEGAAVQIMVRPKKNGWQDAGRELAKNKLNQKEEKGSWFNPWKWVKSFFSVVFKGPSENNEAPSTPDRMTQIAEEEIKALDEKNTKIGFETVVRIITSADSKGRAEAIQDNIVSSFVQFAYPNGNGFTTPDHFSVNRLVRDFVLRKFDKPWYQKKFSKEMVLSSTELTSLFHLPNIRYNLTPNIVWQNYKVAPAPSNIPREGLLLGHNIYRGTKTEIRMQREDRFRHFYVIGQTGTGKSSILQVMIRQDLKNGDGLCVIDPHGQLCEDILPFIPRERADDVIYFNPADTERPLGLNMLEAHTDEERDLVANDAMTIMLKLFSEETFGPRIQDYFRNGVLTLMEDPNGSAITDIVRLFTDDEFQKLKVEHVKNPIVKSFWVNQMAKTGAREKQEMVPYFAAKFSQFITNSMMRNIIGQTKSSFDFSQVMDEGKILLMNLSKGLTGDFNSKLLGLIIVSKIQMAALRRQSVSADQRRDFFLYIDEFQNYITDSIESILSEARKYRLGLNLAHQYINQLVGDKGDEKIKNAVFGNVGSMMCYKIGAQDAEYMSKEMAPVFSDQDLINVDKYKAVMKLSIDSQPSKPFSVVPINPYLEKGDMEIGSALKQLSRLKYGRDKAFIDREITRRIGVMT
jgi:hypothetical protein